MSRREEYEALVAAERDARRLMWAAVDVRDDALESLDEAEVKLTAAHAVLSAARDAREALENEQRDRRRRPKVFLLSGGSGR